VLTTLWRTAVNGAMCAAWKSKRTARKPAPKWRRIAGDRLVCTNETCFRQATWRSPAGSFRCDEHAREEKRKPAPFRRWRVHARDGYADAITFDDICVLVLHLAAEANRAEDIVRELNRRRVVLQKGTK